MSASPEVRSDRRPKPVVPLVALALLGAAWGVSWLGEYRASQLDLSRFGSCSDVSDALVRDGYVARVRYPYFGTAVLLDWASIMALSWAGFGGRLGLPGVLVFVLWLPTAAWHGLIFFVIGILSA